METNAYRPLASWDVHGFHTLEDLDIGKMKVEALTRWLRPNEIHAILCNYKYFNINVKPVELPQSGTIILYDRKMLRNFRKDCHNWKKKKDGKTVKEAHEHLKIGNEDRIHVYYAHGEDNPNFLRRIYWLLDKKLEHIVLVHYREISEDNANPFPKASTECKEALSLSNIMHHGSPMTPVSSNSGSYHSEKSGSWVVSEEIDSGINHALYAGSRPSVVGEPTEFMSQLDETLIVTDHERRLLEINTLEWADLLASYNDTGSGGPVNGPISCLGQQGSYGLNDSGSQDHLLPFQNSSSLMNPSTIINGSGSLSTKQPNNAYVQPIGVQNAQSSLLQTMDPNFPSRNLVTTTTGVENVGSLENKTLQSQDSFTGWIDILENNCLASLDQLPLECPVSTDNSSNATMVVDECGLQEVFSITDVSPSWASSTEETKVMVIGFFHEGYAYLAKSTLYCVFGETYVPAELVQGGVFRCMASPCKPGLVDFYLSLDACRPISQVLSFEYRLVSTNQLDYNEAGFFEDEKAKWGDLQLQIRLAHLLFSSTSGIATLSNKVPPNSLMEAKKFTALMPSLEKDWISFIKLMTNKEVSFLQANHNFIEIILKNKLEEWLLERIVEGRKTTTRDPQGQGVIHLCAMLGYTWAIRLFSFSGLSIDFRDAFGWTALHWAAYCAREKMVANLLLAGANPSLVTDPTPECPGGCTAADLASKKGHDGLAAYLAEEGLTAHFNAMCLSGNIKGSLKNITTIVQPSEDLSEEEKLMRDSLAAYRHAADAASRIQTAIRDRALKVSTKLVQLEKDEIDALNIVSALKIQHAYRNYKSRKRMAAAVRIQHRFHTWKTRRDFLNMRRQAIKIQAVFRGHLVRKQYCKILWSVGVLEKAILRWRQKRKGLRGLQVKPTISFKTDQEQDLEEDFYQMSRKQAEERVERSVVRVQAMFRSYQAQKDYRRMKEAYDQAKLEYDELLYSSKHQ